MENSESDLSGDKYSADNTAIKRVDVNDVNEFDEKLIVIAAEPGMGKTTALTRLGTQNTDDSKWFIRVDLAEYKLEQRTFSEEGSIVEFLSENNFASNALAKKLLASRLSKSGNVVFLLDGFDEISTEGQKNVVQLIKKLLETKVEKVVISTRIHLRNELENSLSTVAYTFKPFSLEDQKEFLKKKWERNLNLQRGQELLDNYINKLLKFISKSIGDKEGRFMGIPLQTEMVAEVFQVTKYLRQLDDPEFSFPNHFDILQLYEYFVDAKYQVYFGKIGAKGINLNKSIHRNWFTAGITKTHEILSFRVLFPDIEPEIKNNFISEEPVPEGDKLEIHLVGIMQFSDNRNGFTHRTFGEYFAAKFLAERLNQKKNKQKYDTTVELLVKELFKSKNEIIRTFLDYHLAEEDILAAVLKGKLGDVKNVLSNCNEDVNVADVLGRSALHYAAQEGHKEMVDILLTKGADVEITDKLGKTALHYAARYNKDVDIVDLLLNDNKDCINTCDYDNHTALYYAAEQGDWNIVDFLIEKKGASVNGLDREKLVFHYVYKGSLEGIKNVVRGEKEEKVMNVITVKDNLDNTLLHIATQKGHLTIANFLLEKGADVGIANKNGIRPINYATEKEHWCIVELLLQKGAKLNDLNDDQKFSLLKYSAVNTHWSIVKLFMEDSGRDNYFRQLDGQQRVELLCSLILSKDLGVVEFLIEKGTAVNSFDSNGKRPIHYAVFNECWHFAALLLMKGANLKDLNHGQLHALLHYSAHNFFWDVVKLFMKDSNRDSYFDKLDDLQKLRCLYHSISVGDLCITRFFIERLIEKGNISDVNNLNSCGKTFLHLAAQDGQLSIVQYLVGRKAKLDTVTSNGLTALLLAAENGHLSVVQYLVGEKVKLDAVTSSGSTALHLATKNGHLEVVKFLVDKGADLAVKNGDGKIPTDLATEEDCRYIKKLLEQSFIERMIEERNLSDINTPNSCGETLLHHAAQYGRLYGVQYLIDEKEAILDTVTSNGLTPLHLASKNGHLEVVEYLVAKGADLTIRNIDGKIPKDLATEKVCSSVVNVLQQAQQDKLVDAARQGNVSLVNNLVKLGANINFKNKNGDIPLHEAAKNGKLKVVEYLIGKGADFLEADKDGKTCIHLAAQYGKLAVIQYLVEDKGADFQEADKSGNSPLHLADANGKLDVLKYLKGKNLLFAVLEGKLDTVQYLVEGNADFNLTNKEGKTALHLAIESGSFDIVHYLVGRNADLNLKSKEDKSPLHLAIENDRLDIVQCLIEGKANLNIRNNYNEAPLHSAVLKGRLDIVRSLLEGKADLNLANKEGKTALHLAIECGRIDMVQYLVGSNADLNLKIKEGKSPFHLAIENDRIDMVHCLIEGEANLSIMNNYNETPLHSAVLKGRFDIVRSLVEVNADLDLANKEGKTALHLAIECGRIDIVQYLVGRNADLNLKTKEDKSPLHLAIENDRIDMVERLVEGKADLDIKNNYKETPLHLAVLKDRFDIVQCLVEAKADLELKNNEGKTPLHYAAKRGESVIVKYLVEKSADLNSKDIFGKTPLQLAVENCKFDVEDYLRIKRRNPNVLESFRRP